MASIHEEYGYPEPDYRVTYLGIFKGNGGWTAAHESVNNKTGERMRAENFLTGTAHSILFSLEFEGMRALQETEIQPLVDLTFQNLKDLNFPQPVRPKDLDNALALLERKKLIHEGSCGDMKAILMQHRNQWPDIRPIKFLEEQPPEPNKPALPMSSPSSSPDPK